MRLHRSSKRATYGPSERRAYALTRSGFQTMPTRRDEDAIPEGAASATARGARAPRFGTRAHARRLAISVCRRQDAERSDAPRLAGQLHAL